MITPSISPDIFSRYPDFHLLSLTVKHAIVAFPEPPELVRLIVEAEATAIQDPHPRESHLNEWAVAYQAFGAKPNRTPCSALALIKRTRKDGRLPRISPLVDAYNAISILHGIPVGGEDLDRYSGTPMLTFADGTEPFETINSGLPVVELPDRAEVIWRDALGVTCRRWNWRQGKRTMVSDESRNLWLVLEALGAIPKPEIINAGIRLGRTIQAICPSANTEFVHVNRHGAGAVSP